MKKENKIRLIFWGVIWIITLILSISGVILYMNGVGSHGKIRKELKPVNDSFNNLSSIIRYREAGIDIRSKLKDDRIIVRYKTDTIDASYDFVYDESLGTGILVMQYGNASADKDISISVDRFMIDAVAVKNNHPEGEIFKNYQFDYFYNTNVIQGLGISDEGTTTTVKINLNTVVTDNITNDNNIPDLNNTSDTIKNWYTSLSTADKMITIIAKKDNENYAKYKTDVSSVAENNKIDLTWIDYETLTETDLKYLSNSYGISNINDFYGMATLKGNKATDIVGVQSINELKKILKESNVIN